MTWGYFKSLLTISLVTFEKRTEYDVRVEINGQEMPYRICKDYNIFLSLRRAKSEAIPSRWICHEFFCKSIYIQFVKAHRITVIQVMQAWSRHWLHRNVALLL